MTENDIDAISTRQTWAAARLGTDCADDEYERAEDALRHVVVIDVPGMVAEIRRHDTMISTLIRRFENAMAGALMSPDAEDADTYAAGMHRGYSEALDWVCRELDELRKSVAT